MEGRRVWLLYCQIVVRVILFGWLVRYIHAGSDKAGIDLIL